jgi:hypothetical protein
MKYVFFLMLAFLFFGCDSDPYIETGKKGPLEIMIDNTTYNFYAEDIEAGIYEGDRITIMINYATEKGIPPVVAYGFSLIFDEHHFTEAALSYIKDGKSYKTADFNSSPTFSVKNYHYDPETRNLSFDYEGKLYESLYEINTTSGSVTVKGKVELKNIKDKTSFTIKRSSASFSSGDFSFYAANRLKESNGELLSQHLWSNDGHRLLLHSVACLPLH